MPFISKSARSWPMLFLRIGLAFILLYAGISALKQPESWIGFLPDFIRYGALIKPELFLQIHSIAEIGLGIAILFGFFKRLTSFLIFLDLLAIVIFNGIDAITFRDIGLIFTALALLVYYVKQK